MKRILLDIKIAIMCWLSLDATILDIVLPIVLRIIPNKMYLQKKDSSDLEPLKKKHRYADDTITIIRIEILPKEYGWRKPSGKP